MAFDQNGTPTVAVGTGIFADADVQNRIKNVETPQVTFAALVDSVLRENTVPAELVIDPVMRRIYSANVDGLSIPANVEFTLATFLRPEAGQSGRSLKWEFVSDEGTGIPNKAALIAPIDSVKPARSVSSLVAAILSALGNIDPAVADADKPMILIDQGAGTVWLVKPTDRAASLTALDAAVPGATNGLKVTMTEPSADGGAAPLIFEGGPTS